MTSTTEKALDRIGQHERPAAVAERIGQATAVEQARAVAEVQAAIVVAQQCPRSLQKARLQILDSCAQMRLAERAFFRFPRAGGAVSGPSVHIARELARCFGNVQYGISELRRADEQGQSEMQAWAWDVENNTRTSHTFIVPHRRDTKRGQVELTDLRDIYENNANNGARRVREAIFAVLPPWYVQEALDACTETLAKGEDGVPQQKQIAAAIEWFAGLGVTEAQMVEKVGLPSSAWTPMVLGQFRVIGASLSRGEVRMQDEFPSAGSTPVTPEEITGTPKPPAAGEAPGFDAVRAQAAGEPPAEPQAGEEGWPETRKPPAEPDVVEPPYREDQG